MEIVDRKSKSRDGTKSSDVKKSKSRDSTKSSDVKKSKSRDSTKSSDDKKSKSNVGAIKLKEIQIGDNKDTDADIESAPTRKKRSHPRPKKGGESPSKVTKEGKSFSYSNLNKKNKELRKQLYKEWDSGNRSVCSNEDVDIEALLESALGEPRISLFELSNRMSTAAASRVAQMILKYGEDQHRKVVFDLLMQTALDAKRSIFQEMCLNVYGHVVVLRMLKYCEFGRDQMMEQIILMGKTLFTSVYGSGVWEAMYKLLPKQCKEGISADQFLIKFLVPPAVLIGTDINNGSLKDTVEKIDGKAKKAVIRGIEAAIDKMIAKKLFKSMALPILIEAFLELSDEEARDILIRRLLIHDGITDTGDFEGVLKMLSNIPGCRIICSFLGHIDSKQRRNFCGILRSSGFLKTVFERKGEEWGTVLLCRMMEIWDDTKQVVEVLKAANLKCKHEQVIAEGKNTATTVCPLYNCLFVDPETALKRSSVNPDRTVFVLLRALTMDKNTYIPNVAIRNLVQMPSPQSKKDAQKRCKEIRNQVAKIMITFFNNHQTEERVAKEIYTGYLRDIYGAIVDGIVKDGTTEEYYKFIYALIDGFTKYEHIAGRNRLLRALCAIPDPEVQAYLWNNLFSVDLVKIISKDTIYPFLAFLKNVQIPELDKSIKSACNKSVAKLEKFGSSPGEKFLMEAILEAK